MTDLTTTITDLTRQAGQLLDLPQQIADTAEARINAIGGYYQQRLATMRTIAYVHQTVGDDQQDGSAAAPLRSIDEALRRTPPGGVCEVRLQADYHVAAPVGVDARLLWIQADGTTRHRITVERLRTQQAQRYTAGLRLLNGARCRLHGLTLVVPSTDGAWTEPLLLEESGLVYAGGVDDEAAAVSIIYCSLAIPADHYCSLLGWIAEPLGLRVHACVATDQPLLGRLLAGATDPAGTATATLPWLMSNLTQV